MKRMGDDDVNVRPLFGGAITMAMPGRFTDISQVRQVPDNQEVFADPSTDQSFIVEILEIPPDAPDADAASFHFGVIASEGGAVEAQLETQTQQQAAMDGALQRTVTWGVQTVGKHRDRADKANQVRVYVACFRSHEAGADIVVSFNSPTSINQASAAARNVDQVRMNVYNTPEAAQQVFAGAIDTFHIANWGLFG